MSEEIIIVDKNDQVIGHKLRQDLQANDIYRASALWLTNSKGEVLLAQRSYDKKQHPGKWGPAVAGTLEKGETYDVNILKECAEELGLINFTFIKGPKTFYNSDYLHFTQWYIAKLDKEVKDFDIQSEEVNKIKWFSKIELEKQVKNNPEKFLPNLPSYFKLLS